MLFRHAAARFGWPRGLFCVHRRCRRSLALAALGYLAAAAPVAATPVSSEPLIVDFFFDLADDGLVGPELGETGAASEILIAGIPIRLGEHDGVAEDGWRTIAGAKGQYALPLTDKLTMISTVRVARTDFLAEGAPGKVVASAATDLRFASDGWTFAVRPGIDVARRETDALRRDSSIEARLSKALGGGLSLASAVRYRWRDSSADQSHVEIAFGRFGLVCRLPERIRLEVAYVVRQEVAAESSRGTGPSVAVTLPLVENIDLTASYDLTRTVRSETVDPRHDGLAWNRHHVGVGMNWDAAGEAADIRVSAAYRYDHGGAAPAHRSDSSHAGTVSFALDF